MDLVGVGNVFAYSRILFRFGSICLPVFDISPIRLTSDVMDSSWLYLVEPKLTWCCLNCSVHSSSHGESYCRR